MRRTLGAVVLVGMVLVGSACQPAPTEPAMTITAKVVAPACLNNALEGTVTPMSATKKVVLQRTVNGKWVDWQWYDSSDPTPHTLSAIVYQDEGGYVLPYNDEKPNGTDLNGTIHLRVRSDKGSAFSNGVYVTYPKAC